MKLYASLTSPYARKVRVVLAEKKIEYSFVEMSPWGRDSQVSEFNPLGKIPVLIMEDGASLFDSRVIVEYLDSVSPVSRLIPEGNRQRIGVKRWEALADGICDAASGAYLERKRPLGQQSADWVERQLNKVTLGIAAMAEDLGDKLWCNGDGYSLADISVGCALGYMSFRYEDIDWRTQYPNLGRHWDKLSKRPAFLDTQPPK